MSLRDGSTPSIDGHAAVLWVKIRRDRTQDYCVIPALHCHHCVIVSRPKETHWQEFIICIDLFVCVCVCVCVCVECRSYCLASGGLNCLYWLLLLFAWGVSTWVFKIMRIIYSASNSSYISRVINKRRAVPLPGVRAKKINILWTLSLNLLQKSVVERSNKEVHEITE